MKKKKVIQSVILAFFILGFMAGVPSVHAISLKGEDNVENWQSDDEPGISVKFSNTSGITWVWDTLRKIIALSLIGLLLAWLLPNFLVSADAILRIKPGASLGMGTLIFFSFPLGVILLIVVIVALAFLFSLATLGNIAGLVALLGMGATVTLIISFIVILSYLVKIIMSFFLGRMIISLVKQEWREKVWLNTLIGSILIALLISIPWVGWMISFIIDLFGLGVLWLFPRKVNDDKEEEGD